MESVLLVDTRSLATLTRAELNGASGTLDTLLLSPDRIVITKDVLQEMDDWPDQTAKNQFRGWYDNALSQGKVTTPDFVAVTDLPTQRGDESIRQYAKQNADTLSSRFLSDDGGILLNEQNLGLTPDRLAERGQYARPYYGTGEYLGELLVEGKIASSQYNVIVNSINTSQAWSTIPSSDSPTKVNFQRMYFTAEEANGLAGKAIALAEQYHLASKLEKIGIAGALFGVVMAARDAQAAYARGDTAGAKSIIAHEVAGQLGGFLVGLAVAAEVAPFLAPLAAAGPVGTVAAGLIVLGVGIAGGIWGDQISRDIVDAVEGMRPSVRFEITQGTIQDIDRSIIIPAGATITYDNFDGTFVQAPLTGANANGYFAGPWDLFIENRHVEKITIPNVVDGAGTSRIETAWSNGFRTSEGTDAFGAYQGTRMNGGELRSYSGDLMVFVPAGGGAKVNLRFVGDRVQVTADGVTKDYAASAFEWDEDHVPGFTQAESPAVSSATNGSLSLALSNNTAEATAVARLTEAWMESSRNYDAIGIYSQFSSIFGLADTGSQVEIEDGSFNLQWNNNSCQETDGSLSMNGSLLASIDAGNGYFDYTATNGSLYRLSDDGRVSVLSGSGIAVYDGVSLRGSSDLMLSYLGERSWANVLDNGLSSSWVSPFSSTACEANYSYNYGSYSGVNTLLEVTVLNNNNWFSNSFVAPTGYGGAVYGSDYAVSMPLNVINGDGYTNTAPSYVVTGGVRPGDNSLSDAGLFSSGDGALAALSSYLESTSRSSDSESDYSVGMADINTWSKNIPSFGGSASVAWNYWDNKINSYQTPLYRPNPVSWSYSSYAGIEIWAPFSNWVPGYIAIDYSSPYSGLSSMMSSYSVAALSSYQGTASGFKKMDPLVIDLDGNGISLLNPMAGNVLFDTDMDGRIQRTGWAGPNDGILVYDRNGNGKIDNIAETFSEYFANGIRDSFGALATLDSNKDGVFSTGDEAFGAVRVWRDRNSDGQTDAGELLTLSALNIASIGLSTTSANGALIEGNEVLKFGMVTLADGSIRAAAAIDFLTSPQDITFNADSDGNRITAEGGVASYAVTAHDDVVVDLAQKGVLSAYGNIGNNKLIGTSGDNWLGGGGGQDTLLGGGGSDVLLIDAEDRQEDIDGGDGLDIVQIVGDQGRTFNLTKAHVEVAIGGRGADVLIGGGGGNVFIRGGGGDDIIIGGDADDALSGEDGDDRVLGGNGDDFIRGNRGADVLEGGNGNDVLDGGLDKDTLRGGAGTDVLTGGFGDDTLDGGAGLDTAVFSGGFAEYRITKLADGRVQVTDTVEDRDGTDILSNMENLTFKNTKDFSITNNSPLPVSDVVDISGTASSYTLTAAELVANDVSWQGRALRLRDVSDAVGGTVRLDGNGNAVFTADPFYRGVMSFRYHVVDSAGNNGATVYGRTVDGYQTTGELQAQVFLKTPDMPDDPLFIKQWYQSTLRIEPVWRDYTGKGVKVAVIESHGDFSEDSIADYTSPDLVESMGRDSYTVTHHNPDEFSNHGTLVAGLITASRNDFGGTGVAYGASLASMSLASGEWKERICDYDVTNNSYTNVTPFSVNYDKVYFVGAAEKGRGGLGVVSVFGAGNEYALGMDTNLQTMLSDRHVVVVAGYNKPYQLSLRDDWSTRFSSPGASILVTGAGTNTPTTMIGLETANGDTFGSSTGNGSGTSAAAPIVSGVVALMLEANASLGYRDVRNILAYSARRTADMSTDWTYNGASTWNGGGLHVSHDYGFGLVDALSAVRLAETWQQQSTASNEWNWSSKHVTNAGIPDGGTFTDSMTIQLDGKHRLEDVQVTLDFVHQQAGDLIVTLTSPTGVVSRLINRPGKTPNGVSPEDKSAVEAYRHVMAAQLGDGAEDQSAWVLDTTHDFGELGNGTWTLKVTDAAGGAVGTLRSWKLDLYGAQASEDDTYVYTEEFRTLGTGSRTTLSDVSGTDTINAAAVLGDSVVDLRAGATSVVAGRNLSIAVGTVIENAFTGDGNDRIIGNDAANRLDGGRGDDTISAGYGDDIIGGGAGSDVIDGGAGNDLVYYDRTLDHYTVTTSGADVVVTGTDGTVDRLTGVETIRFADRTLAWNGGQWTWRDTGPATRADFVSGRRDQLLTVAASELLFNDRLSVTEQLRLVAVGNPVHGTVELKDGVVSFVPTPGFTGSASFEYTAVDEFGHSSVQRVAVSVAGDASTPVMLGDSTHVPNAADLFPKSSAVTPLADGGFVAIWHKWGINGWDVMAQRYDAAANPAGSPVVVNTILPGTQGYGTATQLTDGSILVAWHTNVPPGSPQWDINGVRLSSQLERLGTDFVIASFAGSNQEAPSIASVKDGGYVVTWEGSRTDGVGYDVYAAHYNADGTRRGGEVVVNTTRANDQCWPSITSLPDGGYVVTWSSETTDNARWDICLQRFSATGAKVGSETRINPSTGYWRKASVVASLSDGGFVITWHSWEQPGDPRWGVYVQKFDANGNAVGAESHVNSIVANDQVMPWVTGTADGGYVVAWQSGLAGQVTYEIRGQRYSALGQKLGEEFLLSSPSPLDAVYPKITSLADGRVTAIWTMMGQSGLGIDVVARQFALSSNLGAETADNLVGLGGSDNLVGLGGDDILMGLGGDDFLTGGDGNDTLVGGDGTDEAVYAKNFANYSVARQSDKIIISGAEGTDTLTGIERLRFLDRVVLTANMNGLPVGGDDTLSATEDVPQIITLAQLLANDADPDGSALTLVDVSGAQDCTVTVGADGNLLFSTATNYNGVASFNYTVRDVLGATATARVDVIVAPVNDAPMVGEMHFGGVQGHAVAVSADALQELFSDVENDDVGLQAVVGVQGGTAALDAEGGFVFTPAAEFVGDAKVAVTVVDSGGRTSTATAIITMDPRPVLAEKSLFVLEDQPLTLTAGDLFAEGKFAPGATPRLEQVGNAVGGSVAVDAQGNVVFTPTPDFNGTAAFDYMVSDGLGHSVSQRAVVSIALVNDAPVVTAKTVVLASNATLTLTQAELLGNAVDADGDHLFLAGVGSAVGGILAVNPNGNLTFTPTAGFSGVGGFDYSVADGFGGKTDGHVSIVVPNEAPHLLAKAFSGLEDAVLTIYAAELLAGATDPQGDALSLASVGDATGGVVSRNAAGDVVFMPAANFNGTAGFDYTVSDGHGGTATQHVTVNIAAVNDAPVAWAKTTSAIEDTVLTVSAATLLAGATDVDGDTLSLASVSNAVGGSVTRNAAGDVVFTPTANFNGTAGFDYTVADGHGGTAIQHVTVNVAAQNDAPTASAKTLSAVEDTALTITAATLLSGATDVDGDTLSLASVGNAVGGSVSLGANGDVVFTPTLDFNSAAEFDYTVSDGHGGTSTQHVTVNVGAVNDAPVALDKALAQVDGLTVFAAADLLAGTSDVDGDTLSLVSVGDTVGGTVALDTQGDVVFTPAPGFSGQASFRFTVSDGHGGTVTRTAAIQVGLPPFTMPDIQMGVESTGVMTGGSQFTLLSGATHGQFSIDADGHYAYRSDEGFTGHDSALVQVSDAGGTRQVVVDISVGARREAADAVAQAMPLDRVYSRSVAKTAAQADGSYLVVWREGQEPSSIRSLWYDPSGKLQGSPVVIASENFYSEGTPAVAALADGSFAVAWRSSTGISTTRVSAAGVPLAPATVVGPPPSEGTLTLSVVAQGEGYRVGWSVQSWSGTASAGFASVGANGHAAEPVSLAVPSGNTSTRVQWFADGRSLSLSCAGPSMSVQLFAADGTQLGQSVGMVSGTSKAIQLSGGDFALVWAGTGGAYVAKLAADGTFGAPRQILSQWYGWSTSLSVAALPDGSSIMVWNTDGTHWMACRLNAAGEPGQAAAFSVSGVADARIHALSDGSLVALFRRNQPDDTSYVSLQRYTADLQPIGPEERLGGSQTLSDVTLEPCADGAFLVAAQLDVGTGPAIQMTQMFSKDGTLYRGGSGDDHIIGSGSLVGGNGNDMLEGGAMGDVLVGGSGNDTLIGGAGRDYAVFSGSVLDYQINRMADGMVEVSGIDGVDRVSGVEELRFDDRIVYLDGNNRPMAGRDTLTVRAGSSLTFTKASLLANDREFDGDALNMWYVTAHSGGTLTDDGQGNLTFTAAPGFIGQADVRYGLRDSAYGFSNGYVPINVTPNIAPTAENKAFAGVEDSPLTIAAADLLAGATDAEGDALSLASVGNAVGGTVACDVNGNVVFTPTANFAGEVSFSFTIADAMGGTVTRTAKIAIAPVNDAPVAASITLASGQDEALSIASATLLAGIIDIEHDALAVVQVGEAVGGAVALGADGQVTFTPAPGFHGMAQFSCVIDDGHGGSVTRIVQVNVCALFSTAEDAAVLIPITDVLTDPSSTLAALGGSAGGTVALDAEGNVIFTPIPNFHGRASFTVDVTDSLGVTSSSTVLVEVASVIDPWSVGDVTATTSMGGWVGGALPIGNQAGEELTYALANGPAHGTVSLGLDGSYSYRADLDFTGTDVFTYRVTDTAGNQVERTGTMTVTPVHTTGTNAPTRINVDATGIQSFESSARLADGGFVVVWHNNNTNGNGYDIYSRRYDAAGRPIGVDGAVNTNLAGNQIMPQVAALADGGYVVGWQSSDYSMYAQVYAADGTKAGGEVRLNAATNVSYSRIRLKALEHGGFVAMFSSSQGVAIGSFNAEGIAQGAQTTVAGTMGDFQTFRDGSYMAVWMEVGPNNICSGLLAQRYSASGASLGSTFHVESGAAAGTTTPKLVTFDDGSFMVTWLRSTGISGRSDVVVRRFNADGTPAGAESVAATSLEVPEINSYVLADGSVALLWSERSYTSGFAVSSLGGHVMAPDGTWAGPVFALGSAADGIRALPSIAPTADGGFIAAWHVRSTTTAPSTIMVQTFDGMGLALDAPKAVGTSIANLYGSTSSLPTAAMPVQILPQIDGGYVLVWRSGDGSSQGLVCATVGTAGWLGGSGDDVLMGDGQAERLDGGAGNDTLAGGSGADTLIGGAGRDTYWLEPGGGADMIDNRGQQGSGDQLVFQGIDHQHLWFERVGNDLKASVIGTTDSATVLDWYAEGGHRVDAIEVADGYFIGADAVNPLVAAMAAFAPPAFGETAMTPDQQASLAPVLAANWQAH